MSIRRVPLHISAPPYTCMVQRGNYPVDETVTLQRMSFKTLFPLDHKDVDLLFAPTSSYLNKVLSTL